MVVEDYPPHSGGGGIFVQEVSKRLSADYDITVLTPAYSLPEGASKEEGKATVIRKGKGRMSFFFKALWFLATSGKFHIYHAHGAAAGFLAKSASILKGGKPILQMHGFRGRELIGPVKHWGQSFLAKLGYSRVISVDSAGSKALASIGIPAERISTIPCGVDTEKFRPAEKGQKNPKTIFLFVGRLAKVKGLPTLLKAAKISQEKNIPAEFWIAGEGEEEKGLKSFADESHLENVKFLGAIPHGGISRIYQKADFFILPSLSEGNPLVLLEAMACGLPFLASDIPTLSAMAKESGAGLTFAPADPSGLFALISDSAAMPPGQLGKLRANALGFARRNSWDSAASAIGKIYAGLQ
jgi:glycosyltransferase involved in cell wall biosynthesis